MSTIKKYAFYYVIAILQGVLLWYFFELFRSGGFELINQFENYLNQMVDQTLYRKWLPLNAIIIIPILLYFIKDIPLKKQCIIAVSTLFILLGLHAYCNHIFSTSQSYIFIGFQCLSFFLILPFFQLSGKMTIKKITYTDYFDQMTSNVSLLFQALVVLPILMSLLWLCHMLLSLVNITIIERCFDEPLFISIAYAMYVASTLILPIAKKYTTTLSHWLLAAMCGLFVVLSITVAIFLIFLPFEGLSRLWALKIASPTLLATQLTMLILFNVAMKEGSKATTISWLRYFTLTVIVVLPVLTVISLYSTGLRIHEYGFTPPRLLLLIGICLAAAFSITYSLLIITRRLDRYFGRSSLILILLTAVVIFLLATPVLDIYRISASSQLNRLLKPPQDKIMVYDFTLMSEYGIYGINALNQLKASENFAGYQDDIDTLTKEKEPQKPLTHEEKLEKLKAATVYPVGTVLGDSLYQNMIDRRWAVDNLIDKNQADPLILLMIDLNRDDQPELVIITSRYYRVLQKSGNNEWISVAITYHSLEDKMKLIRERLDAGDFSAVEPPPPPLQDLNIGENVFRAVIDYKSLPLP